MPNKRPIAEKNLDGYGEPIIPWTRALERFETDEGISPTHWLATVHPDGKPHVMPLWAVWMDGAFYFVAGANSRKAKNLALNPHCVITVASKGLDIVVEGKAVIVRDDAKLQRIADRYHAQGWHPTVRNGAFTAEFGAPSAGPPPWDVYEVTLAKVFGLTTDEPHGATRWSFE